MTAATMQLTNNLPFLRDGDMAIIRADGTIGDQIHVGNPQALVERLRGEYLFDNEARQVLSDTLAYVGRFGNEIRAFFWQPTSEREMLREGVDMTVRCDAGRVYSKTIARCDQISGRFVRADR